MTGKLDHLADSPTSGPDAVIEGMDVLSEVLEIIHVRGEQALMMAPEGPRTITFPNAKPCVHIVETGEIAIRVLDEVEPIIVGSNQLALLLHGNAHAVDFGGGGPTVSIEEATKEKTNPDVPQFGLGRTTRCFWGSFSLYSDLAESVLAGLPSVIVISDLKHNPIEWLEMVCAIILDESKEAKPGASVMISRLLDLMLIQILRRWARDAETAPGWLASVQDERISRAVAAMHTDPAHDWSLTRLADLCGMSRSSFVVLFERVMGQAPGAYLREWRLARSAKLLRYSGATIERISEQVGYTSKEAFSRAFSKQFGKSPSTWRTEK